MLSYRRARGSPALQPRRVNIAIIIIPLVLTKRWSYSLTFLSGCLLSCCSEILQNVQIFSPCSIFSAWPLVVTPVFLGTPASSFILTGLSFDFKSDFLALSNLRSFWLLYTLVSWILENFSYLFPFRRVHYPCTEIIEHSETATGMNVWCMAYNCFSPWSTWNFFNFDKRQNWTKKIQ